FARSMGHVSGGPPLHENQSTNPYPRAVPFAPLVPFVPGAPWGPGGPAGPRLPFFETWAAESCFATSCLTSELNDGRRSADAVSAIATNSPSPATTYLRFIEGPSSVERWMGGDPNRWPTPVQGPQRNVGRPSRFGREALVQRRRRAPLRHRI